MQKNDEIERLAERAAQAAYDVTSALASLTASVGLLCEMTEGTVQAARMQAAMAIYVPAIASTNDAMFKLLGIWDE